MTETFSTRQKVAMCAALGAGAILGASGLVVYQRLQSTTSLTTHKERLDVESLKWVNEEELEEDLVTSAIDLDNVFVGILPAKLSESLKFSNLGKSPK